MRQSKPRLTDADYRKDYLSDKLEFKRDLNGQRKIFCDYRGRTTFDAADVPRFGKDLIVQHGFTTNLKGIDCPKDISKIIEYMLIFLEIHIQFILMQLLHQLKKD